MKNKQKTILLVVSSLFLLASCGGEGGENVESKGESSSNVTPSEDTSSSVSRTSALERAFQKNYSNFTAAVDSIAGGDESSAMSWTDYRVNGYDAIYDLNATEINGETTVYYFHDYEGKNYRYYDDDNEPGSPAWLSSIYDGRSCSLKNSYWDFSYFLSQLEVADFTYTAGVYLFTNVNKFESLINDCFATFYDTEILNLSITLDGDYIYKIQAFGEDAESDLVEVEFSNIASTTMPSNFSAPEAPNANNIKEYWQYKGWKGPQVHVYPKTITMTPKGKEANADGAYVLEIEESLAYEVAIEYDVPEGVSLDEPRVIKESDVTFHSSDESIAKVDLNKEFKRTIVGVAEGDAEIWAQGTAESGKKAAASSHVKIHVNGLKQIDMTDAAYSITFDSASSYGVSPSASNSLNSALPFDIEVSKGVTVVSAPEKSLFGNKKVMQLSTGVQGTLNETFQDEKRAGDAVAVFDFSDQQVSGIAFHYGSVYGNSYNADYVTKIAIQTKNATDAWADAKEIDITEEVKENLSSKNLHLMQKSFDPASMVRIVMEGTMIGDSMEMGVEKFVFASNSSCAKHFVADATPVTSVTVSCDEGVDSVRLGKTLQFSAGVKPNNATSKDVVWGVSDSSIGEISSSGLFTPKAVGTVKVYATSYHGATSEGVKSNEVEITVKEAPSVPSGLLNTWVEDDGLGMNKIKVEADKATLTFADGDVVTLALSDIDDSNYCVFGNFVDKDTAGWLKIKLDASQENQATYSYNVLGDSGTAHKSNLYSSGSNLSPMASAMTLKANKDTLKVGDSKEGTTMVTASFAPKGAYAESWTLTSPDTSIVKIASTDSEDATVYGATSDNDSSAKSIMAVGAGEVTLTATSTSGLTASIKITVVEPKKVTSISVSLSSSTVEEGKTVNATASVSPDDADEKGVTWSVENQTGSAKIDQNGLVTAQSEGTVKIVATAKDGSDVKGEAVLTITASTSVSHNGTYTATVTDLNESDVTMTFEISDTQCSVSYDDSVTQGEGTLSLVSANGDVYVYGGDYEDDSTGEIAITVTINFSTMKVTIDVPDDCEGFGYGYANFTGAALVAA